jgi:hypothetical protein
MPSLPRVAFQGELGAFSEEAIGQLWPESATPVPMREFLDVARAVERGEVEFGLLPIENTLAGSVVGSYDALTACESLHVVAETVVAIHHCVLGVRGARLDTLRSVESHPVALAQCAAFFARHPGIEARAAYDTAGAAGDVARTGDPIAIVRGDSQETIVLYTSNGFPPPPPATPTPPTPRCIISGPAGGKFVGPSWSTDGSMLAFQDADGVTTLSPNLSTCALADQHVIAGATSPDLAPAAINPGPRPPCAQPGNPAPCGGPPPPPPPPPCGSCGPAPSLRDALAALVRSHSAIRIRALSRGVRIAFTAPGAGTLAARLSKGRTVLASGSHRYAGAGKGTVTLKLSRKGKRALRRARRMTATLTLTFTPRVGQASSASGKVTIRR